MHAPTEVQRVNEHAAAQRAPAHTPTQRVAAPNPRRRIAAIGATVSLSVACAALYGLSREPADESPTAPRTVSAPPITVRSRWTPPPSLTEIEPDFQRIEAQPALLAAATRWQQFVESYGATDASAVYLPAFRLRTQGTQDIAQATRWWDEWRANGEQISVALENARVYARPADTRPNADAQQCHNVGVVYEMRVPVREIKPNMRPEQLRQIPCTDLQAIYTVRFVQAGRDFRVCHENWRTADLCAACPAAQGCR